MDNYFDMLEMSLYKYFRKEASIPIPHGSLSKLKLSLLILSATNSFQCYSSSKSLLQQKGNASWGHMHPNLSKPGNYGCGIPLYTDLQKFAFMNINFCTAQISCYMVYMHELLLAMIYSIHA